MQRQVPALCGPRPRSPFPSPFSFQTGKRAVRPRGVEGQGHPGGDRGGHAPQAFLVYFYSRLIFYSS